MVRRSDLRKIASLKRVVFWVLAVVLLCALPVWAQKGGAPSGGTGGTRGSSGAPSTGGSPGGTRGSGSPGVYPGSGGWSTVGGPSIDNSQPGVFTPNVEPMPQPTVVEDEACLPWDLPDMRGATVSAMRLGVPSKARSE